MVPLSRFLRRALAPWRNSGEVWPLNFWLWGTPGSPCRLEHTHTDRYAYWDKINPLFQFRSVVGIEKVRSIKSVYSTFSQQSPTVISFWISLKTEAPIHQTQTSSSGSFWATYSNNPLEGLSHGIDRCMLFISHSAHILNAFVVKKNQHSSSSIAPNRLRERADI